MPIAGWLRPRARASSVVGASGTSRKYRRTSIRSSMLDPAIHRGEHGGEYGKKSSVSARNRAR